MGEENEQQQAARKLPQGVPGNERMAALSDGLFSIVFTLLVFELAVPAIPKNQVATELPAALRNDLPMFAGYVMSFVVIGIYWVGQHNMFIHIKRHDRVSLWLNLLFLMCVGFMPFPVNLIVQYGEQQIAVVVYAAVLVATGLSLDLIWWYATTDHRLVSERMEKSFVNFVHRRVLLAPALYTFAIAVSFVDIRLAKAVFVVVALAYIFPNPLDRHHHAQVHRQANVGE